MSMLMDDEIKRWTARRKSALVLEIIQGKTTVAEASRAHDAVLVPLELAAVGMATTQAVVIGSIAIFIIDYVMTSILIQFLPV